MIVRTGRAGRLAVAWVSLAGAGAVVCSVAGCGGSSNTQGSTSSASSQASRGVAVIASTNVYGDIVRKIAGQATSNVRVTSIISDPDQDPHSYEADASTQLALSKADLVIENGGGYDDFIDSMLKGAHSRAKVINVVDLSAKRAPSGGELNEHVWYDFPTVQKLSTAIAQALSAADPAGAATFAANATAFDTAVSGLQDQEKSIRAAHAGDGVAITEPVPLYMLQAAGLVNKTPAAFSEAIEEGSDVPVSVLDQTLGLFRTHAVKVLAYNEQTSGPETEKVLAEAKADKVPVVPVTETLPDGKDYLGWMSGNLQALSSALK